MFTKWKKIYVSKNVQENEFNENKVLFTWEKNPLCVYKRKKSTENYVYQKKKKCVPNKTIKKYIYQRKKTRKIKCVYQRKKSTEKCVYRRKNPHKMCLPKI